MRRRKLRQHARNLRRAENDIQNLKRSDFGSLLLRPDQHIRMHRGIPRKQTQIKRAHTVLKHVESAIGGTENIPEFADRRADVALPELNHDLRFDLTESADNPRKQNVHRLGKRMNVASGIVLRYRAVVAADMKTVDEVKLESVKIPFADHALIKSREIFADFREARIEHAAFRIGTQEFLLEPREIVLRDAADKRNREPDHVFESEFMCAEDMGGHVRELRGGGSPVAGMGEFSGNRLAVKIPAVVENDIFQVAFGRKFQLLFELFRINVALELIPCGVERQTRLFGDGCRSIRRILRIPRRHSAKGIRIVDRTPVDPDGETEFRDRRKRVGKQADFVDHPARFMRTGSGENGSQSIGNGVCDPVFSLKVHIGENGSVAAEFGFDPSPGPPVRRQMMIRGILRGPADLNILHRLAERESEFRRSLRPGGRQTEMQNGESISRTLLSEVEHPVRELAFEFIDQRCGLDFFRAHDCLFSLFFFHFEFAKRHCSFCIFDSKVQPGSRNLFRERQSHTACSPILRSNAGKRTPETRIFRAGFHLEKGFCPAPFVFPGFNIHLVFKGNLECFPRDIFRFQLQNIHNLFPFI